MPQAATRPKVHPRSTQNISGRFNGSSQVLTRNWPGPNGKKSGIMIPFPCKRITQIGSRPLHHLDVVGRLADLKFEGLTGLKMGSWNMGKNYRKLLFLGPQVVCSSKWDSKNCFLYRPKNSAFNDSVHEGKGSNVGCSLFIPVLFSPKGKRDPKINYVRGFPTA